MTRHKKSPLRALTPDESDWLERISRSKNESAVHVMRAKAILAVAGGADYQDAAVQAGQKSADSVSRVVTRFNEEGRLALQPRHGGGPKVKYIAVERERVLCEERRQPDPTQDGTNIWSLTTLQKVLRKAADGLPTISTERIWVILQEAGFRW
jgi:transposase